MNVIACQCKKCNYYGETTPDGGNPPADGEDLLCVSCRSNGLCRQANGLPLREASLG